MSELPTTVVYTVWMLGCELCGAVTELGDADPPETAACEVCGTEFQLERVG